MQRAQVSEIAIAGLKELRVQKAGSRHCSGDRSSELSQQAFGDGFVKMGKGKLLRL
jgi:hypothetical protein